MTVISAFTMFAGEDAALPVSLYEDDGVTPLNISTWTNIAFNMYKYGDPSVVFVTKTAPTGITILSTTDVPQIQVNIGRNDTLDLYTPNSYEFAICRTDLGAYAELTQGVTNILPGLGSGVGAGSSMAAYPVTLVQQTSVTILLQNQATGNGNGTVANTDGYDGTLNVEISNGSGTCTVTLYGSNNGFGNTQDMIIIGVAKLGDSSLGTTTVRPIQQGVITVAANITYNYMMTELYKYVMAVISNASGLGQGNTVNGCTVTIYALPI